MFKVDLGGGASLRPLQPWQATEFLAHMDRARESVDQWISWASRSTDLESATATLRKYADLLARGEGRILGIWLDGVLVGGVLAFNVANGNAEIGCWTEPAARGRGLVTKSAAHLIDWLVGELGIHRVEWLCRPDNVASSNVARRLGMTHEGTLRANFPWQGVRHDSQVWAVLASEWSGRAPALENPESAGSSESARSGFSRPSSSQPVSSLPGSPLPGSSHPTPERPA